jgi:hypothetical protein
MSGCVSSGWGGTGEQMPPWRNKNRRDVGRVPPDRLRLYVSGFGPQAGISPLRRAYHRPREIVKDRFGVAHRMGMSCVYAPTGHRLSTDTRVGIGGWAAYPDLMALERRQWGAAPAVGGQVGDPVRNPRAAARAAAHGAKGGGRRVGGRAGLGRHVPDWAAPGRSFGRPARRPWTARRARQPGRKARQLIWRIKRYQFHGALVARYGRWCIIANMEW